MSSSKFEDFLQELNPLPVEIRRSLQLMRQLDQKKDGIYLICFIMFLEITAANNKMIKKYFASGKKSSPSS